jgi:hypothetical protein
VKIHFEHLNTGKKNKLKDNLEECCMGRVLISPLDWGLGHAMRDIPIIKTLLGHDQEVTIAATGNALAALRREFPECRFIDFPDYPVPYGSSRFFLPRFVLSLPILLKAIARERETIGKICERDSYDLIISDNRLGVYSSTIPSLFISHQLHFHMPLALWPVELLATNLSALLHEKFNHITVPDNPPGPLALAGKLSRPETDITRNRTYFAGILSSTPRIDLPADIDYLILISGPEPQRTRLEEILLPHACELDGNVTVLLGSPQRVVSTTQSENCTIRSYVSNEEKVQLMNRAKFVICRSGYTTMMELAELHKKKGLFIPTPGQTEQEYLSWYYEQTRWFHSTSQYQIDLPKDIREAEHYTGFPAMPRTGENVRKLYQDLLAGYLE